MQLSSSGSARNFCPRPPVRKPTFVCATTTIKAVMSAQEVTLREITCPLDCVTHALSPKSSTMRFWLWSTARLLAESWPNSMFACNHSTRAPKSLTACMILFGTSQKTGKNPPCSVASVETYLPYFHPSAVAFTGSGHRTLRTVWYVSNETLACSAKSVPIFVAEQGQPLRPNSGTIEDTPSPLRASQRMAKHVPSRYLSMSMHCYPLLWKPRTKDADLFHFVALSQTYHTTCVVRWNKLLKLTSKAQTSFS